MSDNESETKRLVDHLSVDDVFEHPVETIERRETHISWIILTGPYAYKIKKPVDLGFLDFSTLADRRHYCKEEVRLNRRTAPEMYCGVVPITGSVENPELDGKGNPIEWCVKMEQFPDSAEVTELVRHDDCGLDMFLDLARSVAQFHGEIAVADPESDHGEPADVRNLVLQNFEQIEPLVDDPDVQSRLDRLEAWSESTFEEEYGWFERRKLEGAIRECHGDMHLKNMFVDNGEIKLFDCIEFNENLRWIDVINDVACLLVDLDIHNHSNWGHRFLNTYLNWTGDYEGVAVLRFYRIYRALVRAKVELMSSKDGPIPDAFFNYLKIAESDTETREPFLAITRGPSASGKSTITEQLLERMDLIRLQSDVIRKQIHDMDPDADSDSPLNEGLYTEEANNQTYDTMAENARTLLQAGYPVIADASFLDEERRRHFHELALTLDIPFHILNVTADEDVLRERVEQRDYETNPSEAGPEVLEYQLETGDELNEEEIHHAITLDTTAHVDLDTVIMFLGEA